MCFLVESLVNWPLVEAEKLNDGTYRNYARLDLIEKNRRLFVQACFYISHINQRKTKSCQTPRGRFIGSWGNGKVRQNAATSSKSLAAAAQRIEPLILTPRSVLTLQAVPSLRRRL